MIMTTSKTARLAICMSLCFIPGCSQQVELQLPQQSAQPAQPELKQAPETPIAEKKDELGKQSWEPDWDVLVEAALPPDFLSPKLSRAVKPFCPLFKKMSDGDKRAFWAYLFQALAGAEAGLEPTTDVRHTEPEVAVEDTVTKRMVRSEGLLQLTYMDADRYGCDFDWDKDKELPEKDPAKTILQPKNNLLCGVKILDNQLNVRHKPLLSGSSYWVTLRPSTISFRVFAKQMANVPDVCHVDRSLVQAKAVTAKPDQSKPDAAKVETARAAQAKSVAAADDAPGDERAASK